MLARIWLGLVLTLIHRLSSPSISNGLHGIVTAWHNASDSIANLSPWPEDFSRDITPIPCHSHNDYWRDVPLYDALAAGCTGVEADIWLSTNSSGSPELLVGHVEGSLRADRSLFNLYTNPLATILTRQNNLPLVNASATTAPAAAPAGVFSTDPNQTLVLHLDFKSPGAALWPVVHQELALLRGHNWLRHWDGEKIVPGPLTIVATGNAPFDLVTANQTCRDVFFDAPLADLLANSKPNSTKKGTTEETYSVSNSYYASAALTQAVGGNVWFGTFSRGQTATIQSQVEAARTRGLVARYWDTPAWPISARDGVWKALVRMGVGMLNVDDLASASRWNWDWCTVAGLTLCG